MYCACVGAYCTCVGVRIVRVCMCTWAWLEWVRVGVCVYMCMCVGVFKVGGRAFV